MGVAEDYKKGAYLRWLPQVGKWGSNSVKTISRIISKSGGLVKPAAKNKWDMAVTPRR